MAFTCLVGQILEHPSNLDGEIRALKRSGCWSLITLKTGKPKPVVSWMEKTLDLLEETAKTREKMEDPMNSIS